MANKVRIKDKNKNITEVEIRENLELEISSGDYVYIDESLNQLKLEIIDKNDLKITFSNGLELLLKEITELICHNPTRDEIAPQFNDMEIINLVTTKLEFLHDNLFDNGYLIADHESFLTALKSASPVPIEPVDIEAIKASIDLIDDKNQTDLEIIEPIVEKPKKRLILTATILKKQSVELLRANKIIKLVEEKKESITSEKSFDFRKEILGEDTQELSSDNWIKSKEKIKQNDTSFESYTNKDLTVFIESDG
ncbi:MAG: hypothetical protein ACNI3C_11500 [Candidatus Marinarcus sp.]|uniref:hypothetical protein n=1 Tax=Candidatus Marinarcus sp. TaxID=3100987 RepID=UPI003B00F75B